MRSENDVRWFISGNWQLVLLGLVAIVLLAFVMKNGSGTIEPPEASSVRASHPDMPWLHLALEDASYGKFVVELSLEPAEAVNVVLVRVDAGSSDTGMICVENSVGIDIQEGLRVDYASYRTIEAPYWNHALRCRVTRTHTFGSGVSIEAVVTNMSPEPRKVMLHAGLLLQHNQLRAPGYAVRYQPFLDCDMRPGTAEEGAAESVVGLWPRPSRGEEDRELTILAGTDGRSSWSQTLHGPCP